MRTAKLLAVTVVTLASLPLLMAQQVNASAHQNASGSASAAGMSANESNHTAANASLSGRHASANGMAEGSATAHGRRSSAHANGYGSAAGYATMRPVTGELQSKLDAKKARVGEPVVLKTTRKAKTANGMVIPRGSRILGHVTEVQAHGRGHEQSSLGVVFNRVEMKHGQSFAIHSMIERVQPSPAALEAKAMDNQSAFAGAPMSAPAGGGVMGGGHAGGGLLGGGAGVVGGATSAVGGAVGPVGSSLNSAGGGALHAGRNAVGATGNLAGNAAAGVGHGLSGSAGAVGSLGTHATAIPGVMLNSSAAGGASGMFTAAKRNVHLDSGTQMVLGVAAAR